MSEAPEFRSCCDSFDRLLGCFGEKGFGIAAVNLSGKRCFALEARPFEPGVAKKYGSGPDSLPAWPDLRDSNGKPVPIVIEMRLMLPRCPWCGRKLDRLIRRQPELFDSLVERRGPESD